MSLRDKVEDLLPNWERWYPSLFDAASDLGIIREEVCDPDSLNLNRRHAKVRQLANDAQVEKWGGKPQESLMSFDSEEFRMSFLRWR